MLLNFSVIESLSLLCFFLTIHQDEAKLGKHNSSGEHRHVKTLKKDFAKHKPNLNKLHGSKVGITKSGERRQFLAVENGQLQTQLSQQGGESSSQTQEIVSNLPTASSLNGNIETETRPLPNRQDISSIGNLPAVNLNPLSSATSPLIEGGLTAPNLPKLDYNFLPNGIELEKQTPVPYDKPEFRLVPKLVPFRYTKKPDVHVSHIHYHQGVNPCQNGGLVVQSPGGYSCVCRKQFRGKHCQEKDHCFPNPCKNGGNCIDHVTHYRCKCPHKYRGLKCEILNTCAKNPCKHGATCLDLASGLRCVCPVGYKGRFCADFDYCNPNPCKNGAKCAEKGLGIICTCTNEYKGNRCEVKKVCVTNPCRNKGKCNEDKSSSPCECAQGFTGKYCEENVCKPNPCLNKGACLFKKSEVSSTWLPVCQCPLTFKGDKCEIPNPCAAKPSPCKHGMCSDAFNGRRMDLLSDHYVCMCERGYMGQKCDVRICDKCDKNAKCLNKECVCNDGYVGKGLECKKLPDPCIPNPCKNFGVCVPVKSSYDCRCPFSFVGARCEQQL
ncbi:adhesive plaque matrix protein 2-like [Dendronephthya gigantea]|uniref:adhesive plaque matrix protein 2-like n=1 Tax=Dendronephthya gigantea TaxID=151771 RepID=UPI00106B5559|nr:adhesive plaque matrix protein 2-like [Dendronephthya gigantea]